MACHPTATSIRHIKNRFSPYLILFVFNAIWALTSGGFRIVSDTLLISISIIIILSRLRQR